jgi:hypothetical protein
MAVGLPSLQECIGCRCARRYYLLQALPSVIVRSAGNGGRLRNYLDILGEGVLRNTITYRTACVLCL